MSRRSTEGPLCRLLAAALFAAAPAAALAQADFPNRPIRIVVPLAPGGTADLLPRMVGEKLTLRWGQPVIVENKPGGALHLGDRGGRARGARRLHAAACAAGAARAEPEPLSPSSATIRPPSCRSRCMARLPYVFVVNPKVPVSNIPELIAFAKANPDKLNFGTPGVGSAQQLAVEWFKIARRRPDHARALPGRGAGHDRSARRPRRADVSTMRRTSCITSRTAS